MSVISHVSGAELRHAVGHFATGVTVVTSRDASGSPVGTTANAVTSLSLDPPLIFACFARDSLTLGAIRESGAFAVNVLGAGQQQLSIAFAQRGAAADWEEIGLGGDGNPRLRDAIAVLDCAAEQRLAGGDHEIVIGRVIEVEAGTPDAEPLLFYRGAYAALAAAAPVPAADEPVRCRLPSRHGDFDAVAGVPGTDGGMTIALVHGDPAAHPRPLVHSHGGCLFGEALGSLLCDCRRALDSALAAVRARGAGIVLYGKPPASAPPACGQDRPTDVVAAAGLLRASGITRVELDGSARSLAGRLRRLGVEVVPA